MELDLEHATVTACNYYHSQSIPCFVSDSDADTGRLHELPKLLYLIDLVNKIIGQVLICPGMYGCPQLQDGFNDDWGNLLSWLETFDSDFRAKMRIGNRLVPGPFEGFRSQLFVFMNNGYRSRAMSFYHYRCTSMSSSIKYLYSECIPPSLTPL